MKRSIMSPSAKALAHRSPTWAFLLQIRFIRRFWYFVEWAPYVLKAVFSKSGLGSHTGRILIWGKWRRVFLSIFPSVAHALQAHYGLTGACRSCGASCKLLHQCPHWDDSSHLCRIYEDRPSSCRTFPITPSDIRDRNLVLKSQPCGFTFKKH